jgi:SAM-dependent methyltransferase
VGRYQSAPEPIYSYLPQKLSIPEVIYPGAVMPAPNNPVNPVDLYDSAYGNYAADVYRQVRLATYGEDLGQTSWVTNEESRAIPQTLQLTPASRVLEIGCGSGGYPLQVASVVGCSIVGVDINDAGVRNANMLAHARHLADRVSFQHCDVSKTLPFPDAAFDAAFANDVLCHIPGRPALLREAFRVLRPSARLLFSDALIIGGPSRTRRSRPAVPSATTSSLRPDTTNA